MEKITIEAVIKVPREKAWVLYTNEHHVVHWNRASDDWYSPKASNDLRVGGKFNYRMEAKDGSSEFDFAGVYDEVIPPERFSYTMGDGRKATVIFSEENSRTLVTVTFDPESENTLELQRDGWQSILNNFKVYAESRS